MHVAYISVGNNTAQESLDFYTSVSSPNFDIIKAYNRHYELNITIVPDRILESNELFHVTSLPQQSPVGQPDCSVDIIIRDDDGSFQYS